MAYGFSRRDDRKETTTNQIARRVVVCQVIFRFLVWHFDVGGACLNVIWSIAWRHLAIRQHNFIVFMVSLIQFDLFLIQEHRWRSRTTQIFQLEKLLFFGLLLLYYIHDTTENIIWLFTCYNRDKHKKHNIYFCLFLNKCERKASETKCFICPHPRSLAWSNVRLVSSPSLDWPDCDPRPVQWISN